MKMIFGRYKGKPLERVPVGYLEWVLLEGYEFATLELLDAIREVLGYNRIKNVAARSGYEAGKRKKREENPQDLLNLPENKEDYHIAMTGNVQEMAAACERIRLRREERRG